METVVLVGASGSGKTRFWHQFTNGYYSYPTTQTKTSITNHGFLLVDTPGQKGFRQEYSWDKLFVDATCIVVFDGLWTLGEIEGVRPEDAVDRILTWSGDNEETMTRILEFLDKEND